MPLLKHLNDFVTLFVDTLKQMGRWRVWLVLGVYVLIGWLLLYVHYKALSPVLYGTVKFWTSLFGEEASNRFFHYPGQFFYLSYFFGWAKLIMAVVLEGLFLGTTISLFRSAFSGGELRIGASLRSQVAVWVHLIGVSVIFNALITLAGMLLPILFAPWITGYARRTLAFDFVFMPFVFTVLLSLFYFAIPSVAIRRLSIWRAIGRSLRTFARRPFTCFFMSGLILAAPVLLAATADRADFIISKLRPELMYWLLLAGLLAEMIANFFWMGTAARFMAEEE
ncbi:MAG: hypothetical protein AB1644_01085 [Candidatus Zixiibacteriota bacterium]